MIVSIQFRGETLAVEVSRYDDDPETNALDVEWRFIDQSPEQHEALAITDHEEASIIAQIAASIAERD